MRRNDFHQYLLIIVLFFFISCNSYTGVDIFFTNKRDSTIKSIVIDPGGSKLQVNNLEVGKSYKAYLSFKGVAKIDGSYLVQIDGKHDSINLFSFGYYTNGYPLEKEIRLIFYKDSTGISYVFSKY